MSLFQAHDISIRFGGIHAVDAVSFEVKPGEVFSIIGPNGAGKTTIFNLISRIYNTTSGRLTFDGQDITTTPPHRIAGLGIARTFQNIELFTNATLLQNLLIGRHCHAQVSLVSQLGFSAVGAPRGDFASRKGRGRHRFPGPGTLPRYADRQPTLRRAQGGGAGSRAVHSNPGCCCSTNPRPV